MRLDAGGEDEGLVDDVVDELCHHHDGQNDKCEDPNVDIQACTRAKFQEKIRLHSNIHIPNNYYYFSFYLLGLIILEEYL